MVGTLIATVLLLSLAWWASRNHGVVPSRFQSILEFPIEFLANIVRAQSGSRWRAILPPVMTIFLLVLVANYVGLLPGVGTIGVHVVEDGHEAVAPIWPSPSSHSCSSSAGASAPTGCVAISRRPSSPTRRT
jgi:F-type H+-transporting ATPase subunit a